MKYVLRGGAPEGDAKTILGLGRGGPVIRGNIVDG